MAGEPDVARAVDKVLRVPDRYRKFTARGAQVGKLYRIDATLLEHLCDLGLPVRGPADERLFDPFDLTNIALSLRLPTPRYVAMRWWPETLAASEHGASTRFDIAVRSQCHDAASCGDCAVSLSPLLIKAAPDLELAPHPSLDARFRLELCATPTVLPEPFVELMAPLSAVEWHLLPVELSYDLGFMHHTQLADCILASTYLTGTATAQGLRARTSFGLLVATPFSATHYWAEFYHDGEWLPADPLLLASLARWGLLNAAQWPVQLSPRGMFWRIHDGDTPLVSHNGSPAKIILPTTRLPAAGVSP